MTTRPLSGLLVAAVAAAALTACTSLPPLPGAKTTGAGPAPKATYSQPEGGRSRPSEGPTYRPSTVGKGSDKFPFQPGAIKPEDFIAKAKPANDKLNTMRFTIDVVSASKDEYHYDVDLDQTDLERLKTLGRWKLVSGSGGTGLEATYLTYGPRCYSLYEQDGTWLTHSDDQRDSFPTSKYLFDALGDTPFAVQSAYYEGTEQGRHKVTLELNADYLPRKLWGFVGTHPVTFWLDDELRVVEYSYAYSHDTGGPNKLTVKQSDFGKPVSIKIPA